MSTSISPSLFRIYGSDLEPMFDRRVDSTVGPGGNRWACWETGNEMPRSRERKKLMSVTEMTRFSLVFKGDVERLLCL